MRRGFLLSILVLFFPIMVLARPLDRHIRVPIPERSDTATCTVDLGAPLDITIDAITPGRRSVGFVQVFGTVTPRKDVDGLRLRFESEGSATIFNKAPYNIGRAPAGVAVNFTLLARFGAVSNGAIHVLAEPDYQDDGFRWSKRETLYAVVHKNRLYTGMGDYQRLERQAIQDDIDAGLITAVEAQAAATSLSRLPATRDRRPFVASEFNADQERMNALVGATTRSRVPGFQIDDHHGSNILVQGNLQWLDENGNSHPVFGASVDIRDEDLGFDENIVTVVSDVNGNYEAVVDNDDGIGAGNRDIYVRVRTANSFVNTRTGGILGGTYEIVGPVHDSTPDGTVINESFTAANTGTGPAMSVFQAGTWIASYAHLRDGGIDQVDIIWPNGDTGSFYDGAVQIEQPDRWDWDTIHHEYGHFIMDQLDIEDNPGGAHNIGDCTSITRGSKDEGLRLAWGEGWPTFFGTTGQQVVGMGGLTVPRVGDAQYDDLEDGSVSYSMEAQDNNGKGEDNEVAVQRLLWDLFDSNNDGRDTVSRSDATMWTAVDGADPETLSGGWAALRAGQSNQMQLLMGEIASDHIIGPRLTSPAEGATVSPASANFSWNADVGCDPAFDGNSFDLVFYNPSTFAQTLVVPGLSGTSTSLSAGQLSTLLASGHNAIWAVEGRNTNSPSTGPYLGEGRAVVVNTPPVANAGTDQTVECTSQGTTSVSLNGTLSSDADGDTLTYSWSAPGIVFNNSTSSTPTGNFPIGTTVVTLTVSDGIQSDNDTVSITVRDTTAPVIGCPVDVTVECTGDLGVQASDPQLAAFFAGVSATDTCDLTPTITNDAPAFFPLGETIVTFTAKDNFNNASSCQARVRVVDSKAPIVTATVTPASLWPPRHNMITINATVTVTDECDPNPTFVLTSITSSEPDNGLGDGDTPGDIQGAAFGTADTQFQVRAERDGRGSGRTYTITFTGSDSSGNTSIAVAQVKVPKNNN
jgi:hypothetical protein